MGIDAANADAVSHKMVDASTTSNGTTTATESITLENLAKGTKYSAFCTATNGAPTWPAFVTYGDLTNFAPLTFTTEGTADSDDDDDDSAVPQG